MKKKQTNTLDSWIDQSELQRLADALAPTDQDLLNAPAVQERLPTLKEQVSSIGLPKRVLDIHQPAAYRAAAFSRTAAQPASEAAVTEPPVVVAPTLPFQSKRRPSDAARESVAADEGPVLRAARALAEVRLRAEENGFIKRRGSQAQAAKADEQATRVPPVMHQEGGQKNALISVSLLSAPESIAVEPALSDFEVPQGPLRSRLEAFVTWAMPLVEASRLVIVDGEGYTLLHRDLQGGSDEGSALADSAMRLTSVLEQVQARSDFARDGALNLPLEEGGWLGVLRCESAGGRLCIAVVTPAPLEVEKTARMKVKLAQTMDAGGGDNG